MLKIGKVKLFLVSSLAIAFTLVIFSTSMVAGQVESLLEIKEKMAGISEVERENLQNLFILVQEIEDVERNEEGITREIQAINFEIKGLEVKIAGEESAYAKKREDLKQVLKSYQRSGPGSYLEILLNSENMTTFLRRVNTLQDLTRNTGDLLKSLEESREKLTTGKAERAEKLVLVEEKLKQSRESLNKKLKLKEDKEKYLASLKEEREYYQKYLVDIQQMWDGIKPLFIEIVNEFSRVIEEGNLPPDAIKTTFSFYRIMGSIDEKSFNDIITGDPRIPKIVFDFSPGKVEIRVPERNLVLTGKFVVLEGHTLKFVAEKGSFYGMPLEAGAIEELFKEGYLILNLKSMLGNSTLNSIDILDGKLEFIITLDFF